jgi:hypothetical protein
MIDRNLRKRGDRKLIYVQYSGPKERMQVYCRHGWMRERWLKILRMIEGR